MSRRHVTFDCGSDRLAGTLDGGSRGVGLLIVSGGNEIRSGAFAGQARLAASIAAKGYPVFRFDRRGVGDSSGSNRGFRESGADIAAALGEFRKQVPNLEYVVAFGNCDAASALMLNAGARCNSLVLANPWTFDSDDAGDTPPAAIRARYLQKLRNPHELWRLVSGKVSLAKLFRGIMRAGTSGAEHSALVDDMREGMRNYPLRRRYLIAANDRTGLAFKACWPADRNQFVCEGASHAFVEPEAREWLLEMLLAALDEQARELDVG